ncbi:MAG: hypothetical protein ACOYJC_06875 [Christensenellales bacterium]|jgi:hypothetical protein
MRNRIVIGFICVLLCVTACGKPDYDPLPSPRETTAEGYPTPNPNMKQYTKQELQEIMDILIRYGEENDSNDPIFHVAAFCESDDGREYIFVELAELNRKNIDRFKQEVVDSDAIVYIQSSGQDVPE